MPISEQSETKSFNRIVLSYHEACSGKFIPTVLFVSPEWYEWIKLRYGNPEYESCRSTLTGFMVFVDPNESEFRFA